MPQRVYLNPVVFSVLSLGLVVANASAADVFYLGTWKIVSATVAPWWTDAQKPDEAETKELIGKSIIFMPKAIAGPPQAACKSLRYKIKDYPADMLFQGELGEMHERDKSVNPVKVAATVGFRGTHWKTLETGCGNELDFHFIDPTTAVFGLNNYIYRMKKQE